MALNTFKCNCLMPLHFNGLTMWFMWLFVCNGVARVSADEDVRLSEPREVHMPPLNTECVTLVC